MVYLPVLLVSKGILYQFLDFITFKLLYVTLYFSIQTALKDSVGEANETKDYNSLTTYIFALKK